MDKSFLVKVGRSLKLHRAVDSSGEDSRYRPTFGRFSLDEKDCQKIVVFEATDGRHLLRVEIGEAPGNMEEPFYVSREALAHIAKGRGQTATIEVSEGRVTVFNGKTSLVEDLADGEGRWPDTSELLRDVRKKREEQRKKGKLVKLGIDARALSELVAAAGCERTWAIMEFEPDSDQPVSIEVPNGECYLMPIAVK